MEIKQENGQKISAQVIGHTAGHQADESTRPIVRDANGRKLVFVGFTLTPLRYAQILLLCEDEGIDFDEALAAALEPLFRAAQNASQARN